MNKINVCGILAVVFFTLVITACSSKEEYLTPESVIKANAAYMNEEDLKAAMSTIHPESPSYPATESMMKQIFDRYDLNFKIGSIKVLEQKDNDAKVEFTQVTKKIKGPDFKNNKATGIHTLKKDGSSWKIYSTEMTNIEFLDKDASHN